MHPYAIAYAWSRKTTVKVCPLLLPRGFELRSLGLVATYFTYCTISPALDLKNKQANKPSNMIHSFSCL